MTTFSHLRLSVVALVVVAFAVLMTAVSAAEFTCLKHHDRPDILGPFDDVLEKLTPGRCERLLIAGRFERGDAVAFKNILTANLPYIEIITLVSPGGSVADALEIGIMIRRHHISTESPEHNGFHMAAFLPESLRNSDNGQRVCLGRECICASSCALIWLAGIQRSGDMVGFHRPTIKDQEFWDAPLPEVQAKYKRLLSWMVSYMREVGAPDQLVDHMTGTSSGGMFWLHTDPELRDRLSDPDRYIPDLDEWLTAKCGRMPDARALHQQTTAQRAALDALGGVITACRRARLKDARARVD